MVFSGKGEGPVASKSLKWDYRKLTINEGGGEGGGAQWQNERMFRHSSDLIVEGYNSSSASISRRDFFFSRQTTNVFSLGEGLPTEKATARSATSVASASSFEAILRLQSLNSHLLPQYFFF